MKSRRGTVFKDIFGISLTDTAQELKINWQKVCNCYEGLEPNQEVCNFLMDLAEKNYKADIETAEYRRNRAHETIERMMNYE